ncbi:hypothetical protein IWQ62_001235 [Dispira parvispora]|uniref:Uncharacterized protein n=1 Tax=Dispira parvispora TaxID=1520584 RepID=A0A9W8AYG0_9FUNG|nr:hypothetical protein IWQ62_001235 [Dispira parvispora]
MPPRKHNGGSSKGARKNTNARDSKAQKSNASATSRTPEKAQKSKESAGQSTTLPKAREAHTTTPQADVSASLAKPKVTDPSQDDEEDFQLPPGWDYCDDPIPVLFQMVTGLAQRIHEQQKELQQFMTEVKETLSDRLPDEMVEPTMHQLSPETAPSITHPKVSHDFSQVVTDHAFSATVRSQSPVETWPYMSGTTPQRSVVSGATRNMVNPLATSSQTSPSSEPTTKDHPNCPIVQFSGNVKPYINILNPDGTMEHPSIARRHLRWLMKSSHKRIQHYNYQVMHSPQDLGSKLQILISLNNEPRQAIVSQTSEISVIPFTKLPENYLKIKTKQPYTVMSPRTSVPVSFHAAVTVGVGASNYCTVIAAVVGSGSIVLGMDWVCNSRISSINVSDSTVTFADNAAQASDSKQSPTVT